MSGPLNRWRQQKAETYPSKTDIAIPLWMSNACPQRKYRPNILSFAILLYPALPCRIGSRPSRASRNFILPPQTQVRLVWRSFRPWSHSMKVSSSQLTLSYNSDNLKPRNSSVAEWYEKNETKKKKLWKESFASKKMSKIEVWDKLNKYRLFYELSFGIVRNWFLFIEFPIVVL
jgi:hypothetical protein